MCVNQPINKRYKRAKDKYTRSMLVQKPIRKFSFKLCQRKKNVLLKMTAIISLVKHANCSLKEDKKPFTVDVH